MKRIPAILVLVNMDAVILYISLKLSLFPNISQSLIFGTDSLFGLGICIDLSISLSESLSYDFGGSLPVSLIWSLMHEHVTGDDKYQHLMKDKVLVGRLKCSSCQRFVTNLE